MSGSECGVRCLRTSTVSSENDREYIHGLNEATCTSSLFQANEKEGYSAGERTTGSTEDGERLIMENEHKGTRSHGAAWQRGSDYHEEEFRP